MPIYDYEVCKNCGRITDERRLPMEERDNQVCVCGEPIKRLITFEGSVWAPTAGGMR